MVGGIVLIDVGIMVAWEIEDPLEWAQQNFTERVSKEMKTVPPNIYGFDGFFNFSLFYGRKTKFTANNKN